MDSRTIRKAFWLLSIGLHLWAANVFTISESASCHDRLSDLNWLLHRSQTPIAGGDFLTIRRLRFGMSKV